MKKILLLLICCLVLFFAISIIPKSRTASDKSQDNTSNKEIEIQQIDIDEVTTKLILYDSTGVEFAIPFSSIPIYEEYLNEQSNQRIEIERTSSEFINLYSSDGSNFIVLKFNCGVKLCSSLLVKISKNKDVFTSIELGYGMLVDMKQSPNAENAVFRYGVNEGNVVIRNNLILVDPQKMILLNPVNKEVSKEFVENAIWPITEYKWVNDKLLSIHAADSQDPDYHSLLTWYNSSRKTKEIEIDL